MDSKIIQDLQTLVEKGVISSEIADNIERYYESQKPEKGNRLFTIFAVMGSLLIGLGIILVLAHNWDEFSKTVKTIFAFIPLIIGQLTVGYSIIKNKSNSWLESSGTFLFFAVGSCISLISQIYNIPGSLNSFLFAWILLCIPLVYLLKSKAVFLLTLIFSTVYACDLGYNFSGIRKIPWKYLIIIAILSPAYVKLITSEISKNTTAIINWLLPLSLTIVLGAFIQAIYQFELIIYMFLFGLLYNIGQLKIFKKIRISKNGFIIFGSLGIVFTMLLASSKSFWSNNIDNATLGFKEVVITFILLITTIGILFRTKAINNFSINNIFQFNSLIIILVYITHFISPTISILLMNFILFALGIHHIKKGIDTVNFTFLNYGLLIITALILARFFDTNITFVVRGLLFIAVGVGFFVANYLMLKKMKSLNSKK